MRQLSQNHFYRLHDDVGFQLVFCFVDGVVDGLVDVVDSAVAAVAVVVAANQLANCHLSNFRGKFAFHLPRDKDVTHMPREAAILATLFCLSYLYLCPSAPHNRLHLSCTKLSLISICLRAAARVAGNLAAKIWKKKN